ncbi:ParB/RepB/Spo0J family partition protein [Sphingopyxis sp. JAI108]|uniref:ParB/RepB/Spo0J family partition protein n=1 Tax=Sphingopyxis sp. JAI108 TaxID=2723060 RepID=UPI0015C94E01|nr:ParB/RepB/Spo0J family partition protein [Sphingopyxis sp. JAI108]NYF33620.1 ParB family chromosome partitioning protein [Sphingopyxis sp. JAI108]
MAKPVPKLTLNQAREIPLDRLELSQSNVRRVKAGVSIDTLAADIARRGLLQSLGVRPMLDGAGQETGRYEVPFGGRRYRALELLVKQNRLAKDVPIPCMIRPAGGDILAEEDSYAENAFRENLHPLDEFRAMQAMVEKGNGAEAIAAHFHTTPAVVRQRLKLATVSPRLLDLYGEDEMSLDVLMAFTVSDDHDRQCAVWDQLEHSFNKSPSYIRQRLTENSVRAADKRARFVGIEAYLAAGGGIVRDLFEADAGGWLTDPALLDRLVDEKLTAEGERIAGEGWKWVVTAIDLPWSATSGLRRLASEEVAMTEEDDKALAALEAEADDLNERWAEERDVPEEVHDRLDAIEIQIGAISDRPLLFDPTEVPIGGAFVSIDHNGTTSVERGFVRPEDEPAADAGELESSGADGEANAATGAAGGGGSSEPVAANAAPPSGEEDEGEVLKPLSDRLVSDLTAWRTLALQNAIAGDPALAFLSVLHAFVLDCFFRLSEDSCVQVSSNAVYFSNEPPKLRDCAPGQAIAERAAMWRDRLPKLDKEVWDFLLGLDPDDQSQLFAHCASVAVNAQAEIVPKYDNGRISKRKVERRIAHSHVLARAVGLDVVQAGWKPTAAGYFGAVTKPRILADVAEAKGENFAQMIDHLKKADMAREAERLLEECDWLPEPLRTPVVDGETGSPAAEAEPAGAVEAHLPPYLDDDDDRLAVAAE